MESKRITTTKQWGCFKTIIVFVLTGSALLFGGLGISKWLEKDDRAQVDQRPAFVKAVVINKYSNSKGRSTAFRFIYKGKQYRVVEGGRELYNRISVGDSLTLKIDSLNPKNAFAILFP